MYRNLGASRLIGILSNHKQIYRSNISKSTSRLKSTNSIREVTIGNVTKEIKTQNSELVPRKFYQIDSSGNVKISPTILHHLRWIMQKDCLNQDVFLIGKPGSLKRSIAMQYLQLTQREFEYITLNRDTTESDIKQRREIVAGTAKYFDQSAVRAATEGRILVIEGVEKAERNVLPVINNLLENREMHLEDGRLLIPANRYDKLLKDHSKADLDKWGLVRVSEDFRVFALGLPVPKYRGNALDPPLRSRFQARDIQTLPYSEILLMLKEQCSSNVPEKSLEKILSFGFAILSPESSSSGLPDFPIDSIFNLGQIYENNPNMSEFELINRLYPLNSLLLKEQTKAVETLFEKLKIQIPRKISKQKIVSVENLAGKNEAKITMDCNNKKVEVTVPSCNYSENVLCSPQKFIETDYQSSLLCDLIQTHAVGDFCLIGPRGCGKTAIVQELSKVLNHPLENLVLYKDMTSRDLIQQRTTDFKGDTQWKDSPLVQAAKKGHIIVLDGIHRLHSSTISSISRLIHDREIQLFDGTRLLRHDKYDELLESGSEVQELAAQGILRIHPAFRIIALAEPQTEDASGKWLTPEILTMFMFHEVRNLSKLEEIHIIRELYGKIEPSVQKIIDLAHLLRDSNDPITKNLSQTLSTRQLLRIAHRFSIFTEEQKADIANTPYELIQRVFMAKFLPSLPRSVLESCLKKVEIFKENEGFFKFSSKKPEIQINDGVLKIGNTYADIYVTKDVVKVPDIVFFDIPQHVRLLENLLQDFKLGNHLLLVGNQGVGKNKLVDRLLQLMNRPREYIQLHRDTTVQSLTIQPNVVDGRVVYEDSPLVKAVKSGHVLVIDEADKAPTNVTCILKNLVESGEMILSDGRKILPANFNINSTNPIQTERGEIFENLLEKNGTKLENLENFKRRNDEFIHTHPDFLIIVLGNRPGYPFLGNNFYASIGHLFNCYAVENPDTESEVSLLQLYGPNVDKKVIKQLVCAFSELRTLADMGSVNITYPYSTREVVNIVRHLEKYPDEDVCELIGNVLDFDRYSPEALENVTSVLIKHGLQIGAYAKNELASIRKQKEIQLTVKYHSGKDVSGPKRGKVDPKNEPHVGGNTWAGGTGGRDTAGLGGKGGPYRLDAGHKVHQLSDAEKDDIPEEVKAAARAMNRKAFEEKLKEIKMSQHDHGIYEQFRNPVKQQISNLRIILNSLEAKSKERHWQKHQTTGELDDMKLIEGITGEKAIYKKRTEQDPEPGQPQEKPKRLTFVADVSGSMYRFNGYDGRLDRELEAVVMIMEAFQGFDNKIQYDILGHSGESPCIPFIDHKNPPMNDKVRFETIKMMHAHSQYCWQGDHTVAATRHAIDTIAKEDCDEAIVVVLSDANLSRYSISPVKVTEALIKQDPKVQGYIIFIGSLGEEAVFIKQNMPEGRAFICMDNTDLPQILKTIFQSSLLKQSVA